MGANDRTEIGERHDLTRDWKKKGAGYWIPAPDDVFVSGAGTDRRLTYQ